MRMKEMLLLECVQRQNKMEAGRFTRWCLGFKLEYHGMAIAFPLGVHIE